MLAIVLSIIMHAQIGGGVPALGSTQGSVAVAAVKFTPTVLVTGSPWVLVSGHPVVLNH